MILDAQASKGYKKGRVYFYLLNSCESAVEMLHSWLSTPVLERLGKARRYSQKSNKTD